MRKRASYIIVQYTYSEMAALIAELSPLKIYDVRRTDRKLGAGAFGTVSEVEWNGTTCAAKFMHDIFKEILSAEEKEAFIAAFEKECATWSALRHPQIVQFLGIYFDTSHTPVMVLEKMDASLRMLLESTSKDDFPLINKVVILRQVSQGLVYLHSHSPKLVHHDLSPNNILVNEVTYLTKLTDFGMTRAIDAASLTRSSSIKGTPGFMPPEALHYPLQYDDKLDVFSYGNLIIMTITHEWPTPVIPRSSAAEGEKTQNVEKFSQLEMRAPYLELFSEDERKLFQGMVKLCLDDDAGKRPTSSTLLPQMKRVEKAVLKSYSIQEQDSNVQLAMWRMQKDLESRDIEVVRVSKMNAELVSHSSVADQKVKNLKERIDNVHLRLRLQGKTVPSAPLTDSRLHEMSAPSANEPSIISTLADVEEIPESRGRCQWCFKQGRCVCALFTIMMLSSVLSFLLGGVAVIEMFPPRGICSTADFGPVPVWIGVISQICVSFFLILLFLFQSVLWCRGVRDRVLIVTCSPILMVLVVSYFTTFGVGAPYQCTGLPTLSAAAMGIAVFSYITMLQWKK